MAKMKIRFSKMFLFQKLTKNQTLQILVINLKNESSKHCDHIEKGFQNEGVAYNL